eukprot:3857587-Rhodomonas_salina.3
MLGRMLPELCRSNVASKKPSYDSLVAAFPVSVPKNLVAAYTSVSTTKTRSSITSAGTGQRIANA